MTTKGHLKKKQDDYKETENNYRWHCWCWLGVFVLRCSFSLKLSMLLRWQYTDKRKLCTCSVGFWCQFQGSVCLCFHLLVVVSVKLGLTVIKLVLSGIKIGTILKNQKNCKGLRWWRRVATGTGEKMKCNLERPVWLIYPWVMLHSSSHNY